MLVGIPLHIKLVLGILACQLLSDRVNVCLSIALNAVCVRSFLKTLSKYASDILHLKLIYKIGWALLKRLTERTLGLLIIFFNLQNSWYVRTISSTLHTMDNVQKLIQIFENCIINRVYNKTHLIYALHSTVFVVPLQMHVIKQFRNMCTKVAQLVPSLKYPGLVGTTDSMRCEWTTSTVYQ